MKNYSIEQRACELAHYIVDSKDTVRGAAKKFGISKSTVHMVVTFRNGLRRVENDIEKQSRKKSKGICVQQNKELQKYKNTNELGEWFKSIAIRGVFLSKKNPVVNLKLLVK